MSFKTKKAVMFAAGPETPERALRLEAPGVQGVAASEKHGTPGQDAEGPPRRNLPPKIELLLCLRDLGSFCLGRLSFLSEPQNPLFPRYFITFLLG